MVNMDNTGLYVHTRRSIRLTAQFRVTKRFPMLALILSDKFNIENEQMGTLIAYQTILSDCIQKFNTVHIKT